MVTDHAHLLSLNRFTGAVYTRYRNESYVGTEAGSQPFNPGTFKTTNTGEWVGGPIVKNKLFFFQSFEKQNDTRPLTTFTSNPGGAPVAGNTTRVLASDLAGLSSFLRQNFNYETGPFDNVPKLTPAKPWMIKANYNVNNDNKVTFRYNQLDSSTDANHNGSGALGTTRQTQSTNFLTFANSNYAILENIKSGVGEWTSVFSSFTNDLIIGNTSNDESRKQIQLFPFVVIGDGAGSPYTAFGSEPMRSPATGDLWYDIRKGRLHVYGDDGWARVTVPDPDPEPVRSMYEGVWTTDEICVRPEITGAVDGPTVTVFDPGGAKTLAAGDTLSWTETVTLTAD